jgi:uncharacterized protein (TIGR02145 family)
VAFFIHNLNLNIMGKTKKRIYCYALLCAYLTTSCVNSISSDIVESGSIPVSLSASIQSRVANNNFEDNDEIGVFMLSDNQKLSSQRYLDNKLFKINGGTVSGETVYYPAGNATCTFISYYPYKSTGITAGESTMDLTVANNQSKTADYTSSDFLVAKKENVTPSSNTVILDHKHKLSLMNIILQPETGSSAEELLKENPEILVSNVYTQCKYNPEDEVITDLKGTDNIVPHGDWKIENGKLVGKSVIMVPQKIAKGAVLFTIVMEGRNFKCVVNDDFDLKTQTNNSFTIPCSKWNVGEMTVSISDWEKGVEGSGVIGLYDKEIPFSALDFKSSGIYNIRSQGNNLFQLCKEYLLSSNIDAQAIVAYPIKNGSVDLSNGQVLKFFGSTEKVGGKVSWGEDKKLTYSPGDKTSSTDFYIDDKNQISLERPENALNIILSPETLVDTRDGKTVEYPIVKIGSQYWMAADLSADKLNDGTTITVKDHFLRTDEIAVCYKTDRNKYLYNIVCANSDKIAPNGWKLPNNDEWTILWNYVGEEAAKLKDNNWGEQSTTSRNITGFNGSISGNMAIDTDGTDGIFMFGDKIVAYWSLSSLNKADGRRLLYKDKSTFMYSNIIEGNASQTSATKGYSIRCLKK